MTTMAAVRRALLSLEFLFKLESGFRTYKNFAFYQKCLQVGQLSGRLKFKGGEKCEFGA